MAAVIVARLSGTDARDAGERVVKVCTAIQ